MRFAAALAAILFGTLAGMAVVLFTLRLLIGGGA